MNSHITMKEMAVSEQPCEKCFRYGAHCLSDAELLAVILRTGTRDITALQLAQSFLSLKEKNLLNLVHMNTEEMMKISGIGKQSAISGCFVISGTDITIFWSPRLVMAFWVAPEQYLSF